jgi:hypothetical protein
MTPGAIARAIPAALNTAQEFKAPIATGVQLAASVAGEQSKSARNARRDLFERWNKLQTGQLGMSDAEKSQASAPAAAQIAAQQAAQDAQLRQQQAQMGGAGRSGAMTQAQGANNAAAQAAQAGVNAQINAQSQAQAQQAAAQVRADMNAQAAHVQALWAQRAKAVTNPDIYRPEHENEEFGNSEKLDHTLNAVAAEEARKR